MRGEYGALSTRQAAQAELPPRARRIHVIASTSMLNTGTTSACAENTRGRKSVVHHVWNYLRVRGEYCHCDLVRVRSLELPPRARRILRGFQFFLLFLGTTSACAENTRDDWTGGGTYGNYLRVRGEYGIFGFTKPLAVELPPRARRIRQRR